MIATPHYLPWRKTTSPQEIEALCIETKKEKHAITMDIYRGNEIYYTMDAIQRNRLKFLLRTCMVCAGGRQLQRKNCSGFWTT